MPTVRAIESRIFEQEGFRVRIVTDEGTDVRGDRTLRVQYTDHVRRAADTATVSGWKRTRFATQFPGFGVEVLLANGETAHGATLLKTVRQSY